MKKYLLFVTIVLTFAIYVFLNLEIELEINSGSLKSIKFNVKQPEPEVKSVLIHYQRAFSSKSSLMRFGINETWQREYCNYECKYTYNVSLVNSTDAVVLHSFDMGKKLKRGNEKQVWIFFQQESQSSTNQAVFAFYENFFNWTMTYRKDSDIYFPYGQFVKGKSNSFNVSSKINAKPVAWIVSNCGANHRNIFANELEKFIAIDRYGSCGKLKCSQNTSPYRYLSNKTCQEEIGPNYKFYLALENSLCPEYVTEKFFEAIAAEMVPIVNGENYDYNQIAPPNSFIDKSKFNSTEDLSTYLKTILGNETQFAEFFEWRDSYKLEIDEIKSRSWCSFCTKLHQSEESVQKTYANISNWWFNNYTNSKLC